jgi:hypothetical protein
MILHAFAAPMIGLSLNHIWRGHGSAIFLEFGELRPRLKRNGSTANPMGQMSLMIEWSWRIEDHAAVRCGSWSEEELWPDAFATILDSHVQDVKTFSHLPEIEVTFSNGMRILSFMTAEGSPAWTLFDRRSAHERWLSVDAGILLAHTAER